MVSGSKSLACTPSFWTSTRPAEKDGINGGINGTLGILCIYIYIHKLTVCVYIIYIYIYIYMYVCVCRYMAKFSRHAQKEFRDGVPQDDSCVVTAMPTARRHHRCSTAAAILPLLAAPRGKKKSSDSADPSRMLGERAGLTFSCSPMLQSAGDFFEHISVQVSNKSPCQRCGVGLVETIHWHNIH